MEQTVFFLYQFIDKAFACYFWMIIIVILSSWFPEAQDHKIIRFMRKYTDPYMDIFRRVIPPIGGTLDISPLLALFMLHILEAVIKRAIFFSI